MSMQEALRANSFRPVVMFPPRWSSNACSFSDLVEPMGAPLPVRRDVEIYGESEPAEHLYMVVSGAVRTYKVLVDGRRQICAFHLPGDFFGLETGETHSFSAEAVNSSKILAIKRSAVMVLAQHDNEVARQLWTMTGAELRRMQAHVLLLIKTAKERVAAFLLEMAERTGAPDEVELPMSRQDIADYLGLTIETVSRTLTDLENAATIALPSSRRVVLRDRDVLCRYG
jgi:CRP/FNR family transcriptional regulator, nitrogen fixation regulation protein